MQSYPLKLELPLTRPVVMQVHESGDQHVSKAIRETGQWELFETQLLAACWSDAANFVDVGGNIGYYSMLASALKPSMPIYAFEPEPKNAEVFQANMRLNESENIEFFQAGLAAQDSKLELYLSDDNYGDHQIYDRGEGRSSVTVELLNGAQALRPHIDQVDVLKIDTQGAEFDVISGLMPLLESHSSLQMVIEFWPFGLKKAGSHGHKLLDLLLSLNLDMFIIDHINHHLIPCEEHHIRDWIDSLDIDSENEGFMNLFFGQVPSSIPIQAA